MICVYPPDCADFSNNGLGVVRPLSCTVTETLNGEWELTLVHPIDEDNRWSRLSEGYILRAPVPAAMTPAVNFSASFTGTEYGRDVYAVDTDKDYASVRKGALRLRTGPGTGYKVLQQYPHGTSVNVLDTSNAGWYEVVLPDGKRGYMDSRFLRHSRTEATFTEAIRSVAESRPLRDQPFRIYRVVPELSRVTVYARHIFYDLLDNMVREYRPSPAASGAAVVKGLSERCLSPHGFRFYSDLSGTAQDVSFQNINPVEALLGEDGVTGKYRGELARDWYDVYLVQRVGRDTDIQIREGKNLLGISYDVDETGVTTRILPTGEDRDGGVLYLPELYVDSPYLSSYPHPKWMHLPVSEARESDDEDHPKTKEQCFIELREAAQAQYDAGCDLPDVTLKVDFLNLRNTEEYKQFGLLSEIYLGDSVRVVVPRLAVEVSMRMTQYTYDCLLQKYTAMTLGTAADTLEGVSISSRQLAPGSITGSKLALNTIGAGQLINGSVGSLKIRNAAIGSAHIQTAAITEAHIARALIETLNTNALTAVTARIRELAAGSVTTDELYASVAAIAAAQITAANIVSAHVNWAEIDSLSAAIARISRAQLTTANIASADIEWASIQALSAAVAAVASASIRTADIDWARIKDLATDTAIITKGVGGRLYISDLAVTEGNMVNLTVGELVVKGKDGHFYVVSVDESGQVTASLKQIGNDDVQDASIDGGEKIIEGSITAKTLNVQNIFGDTAVIRSLIAANLDVDALFAREATVTALNAVDIRGNRFLRILVDGKADQESVDGLTERMSRAELRLTDSAIVSTVTGSETYRQDRQKLRDDLEALIRDRENWHIADQPPEAPAADTLWLDTSVTPHLLKRWDGAEWVSCGAETDLSQYYTKTEMDTRLEQTDSGIAALSNRITTTAGDAAALAARLEQAELKITPEAITSAVRETGLYQYGAYEGRNYLRSSGDTLTFTNGNLVENGEETSRRYVTLPFSQDLFEHSGNASSLYLSFDIRRTDVALGGNNSVRAYAGFWFRYTAADAEGGVSNGDRGWYRRVTDAGFVSTDEDWVRIKLGPLDLSGFNAASLRDFQIGINAAYEVTGTVQIRHILVEANSQTGIWSPAPEELDSVAERLALAESFIRQNASSIALKVSQAEFDQRMEEAALTISPEQIISAVRSSTGLYHYEPYAGRNYALDSEKTRTFVDGLLLNEDGTASANRFAILKFSPDLFANSTGSAGLRLSFDIKYSDVVPADGKVFSCWFYYTKLSDAGDPVTSGVGWHLSGSGTVTTDWQRVRLGPVKMENYGATGLSYLALGLNASFPVTGMTQIRRVMVEYGDAFTDWDMAPEDPDALVLRLRRAESSITQNAIQISTRVSRDGIISAINQSAEAVSILASKINFNGLVTANQYFKINTDGSMTCTNGTFSGTLNGAKGTFSGALSAATGTFAGMLSAATGTFAGTLSAGNWTFNSNGSVYSNGNYAVYMNVSGGVANFYTQNLAAVYGSTSYNDTTIYGGAVTLNCASTGQSVSARNGYWGSYSYSDVCLVCDQSGNAYATARGNLGTRDNRWDILWVDTVHYNSRASDSSREIKHDIHPLTAMGEKLDRLVPVSFVYNDDRRNWKRYGLIYEDTLPVMPEICHEIREGEGVSKGISYEDLIAVLVKEVQDLRARVTALETKQAG